MIQSLLTRIDSDRVNRDLAHAMAMADHKFTLENLHEDSNVHGMSWTFGKRRRYFVYAQNHPVAH